MKQGAITTAPIQYFPLDALYLSDMNPRQDVDADRIDQLADSIVAVGLLQNLAGLADEAGHVGIVAGGRRLRALIRAFEKHADLLDRRPELAEIPVRLAPDEATMTYEDTVADLPGRARAMTDFLDMPWDDRCLDFHQSGRAVQTPSRWQVRQPIYRSSVARWRRYEAHVEALKRAFPDAV